MRDEVTALVASLPPALPDLLEGATRIGSGPSRMKQLTAVAGAPGRASIRREPAWQSSQWQTTLITGVPVSSSSTLPQAQRAM